MRARRLRAVPRSPVQRKGFVRWLVHQILNDKLPLYTYWQSVRVGVVAYVVVRCARAPARPLRRSAVP